MKYTFFILFLCLWLLWLTSCATTPAETQSWANTQQSGVVIPWVEEETGWPIIEDTLTLTSDKWSTLIINDFWNSMSVSSPLVITWKAPRKWFFEWIFPVILTVSGGDTVTKAWATGDWLVPVSEDGELLGDDMIDFTVTLEYSDPVSSQEGTIIFKADNPSGEAINGDQAEVNVIFN